MSNIKNVYDKLSSLYVAMTTFSEANASGIVNEFKLKLINKTLKESNELLGDKFKPYEGFDYFSQEMHPTYSDVVIVLQMYLDTIKPFLSFDINDKSIDYVDRYRNKLIQTNATDKSFR